MLLQQHDDAAGLGKDAFHHAHHGGQGLAQGRVGGDQLQYPPFAIGHEFRFLPRGNVDDAGSNQAPSGGRQPMQPHFTGNLPTSRAAVQPLEYGAAAIQSPVDVTPLRAE